MEMTDAKVVEKKIYEEGKKHDDYASKATGNAGRLKTILQAHNVST